MITSTPDGVLIDVRVTPRASHSRLDGAHAGALRVRLHAPPVDGAANDELIAVMAEAFGVPKRAVAIVSGQDSRSKRVRVSGVSAAAAQQIVEASGRE
jgi:uncharacterized protein (TIGR00251 family)